MIEIFITAIISSAITAIVCCCINVASRSEERKRQEAHIEQIAKSAEHNTKELCRAYFDSLKNYEKEIVSLKRAINEKENRDNE